MPNPRRAIFVAMTIGVLVTMLNMSEGGENGEAFWRVGISAPIATLMLLVMAEVAPELAVGFAASFATGALVGGKTAADFIVRLLGGRAGSSGAGTVSTIPAPASSNGVLFPNESQLA